MKDVVCVRRNLLAERDPGESVSFDLYQAILPQGERCSCGRPHPRLGLALRSAGSDVAVFWPASGLAAGILITFGQRARPALVIGVVVGRCCRRSSRRQRTSHLNIQWHLECWRGRSGRLAARAVVRLALHVW